MPVKEEKNGLYGIYYDVGGEQIDKGVVEIVDTNCYYV